MKKTLLTFALMAVSVAMMAVPAKRGLWKTLRLADGTEVRATLVGDEFGHCWQATDGQRYVQRGDVFVVQTAASARKSQQRRIVAQQRRELRMRQMQARRAAAPAAYTGDKKGLIILVEFKDIKFQPGNDQTLYNHVANTPGYTDQNGYQGSVADYFKAQSRGVFNLTFDVVGPVTVSGNVADYGENMPEEEGGEPIEGNDRNPEGMVAEAVTLAKSSVSDWAQYDWDGDGEVDQVMIIYAGEGEASGGDSNTIWPHEYSLCVEWEGQTYGERVQVANGLYVNTYAVANEIQLVENEDEESEDDAYLPVHMGIGTICHEFSHCLGLPDMYDTAYSGNFGMGAWSLMDQGSYNGDGFVPSGYTSFDKYSIGWITPTELTGEMSVSAMRSLADADEVYKITNAAYPNEYYLLENRQQKGWDAGVPASGLLILHVDYDPALWEYNLVNTPEEGVNDHQRCTIFHADGKDKQNEIYAEIEELYFDLMYGLGSEDDEARWDALWEEYENDARNDVYPLGNTELSNTTKPRAFLYNANTDGRKLMNIRLSNIRQNADGTIAFSFAPDTTGSEEGDNTDYSVVDDPAGEVATLPFKETFDKCHGKGGNDGEWKGSIAAGQLTEDDLDNMGWTAEKGFAANQCAKFGTGSVAGWATSPAIAFDGEATLTFKAGAWNANADGTTLTVSVSEGTVEPATFTMTKGEWSTFTAKVTATGNATITFATDKGRFFLDEVSVVGENTAITTVRPSDERHDSFYLLDGRRAGNDYRALQRGLYVVNGKKMIK